MRFDIPKTTRFLELQGYDPENSSLSGVGIHIWVDPPRSILVEFDQLNREYGQELNKLANRLGDRKPVVLNLTGRLAFWLGAVAKKTQGRGFQTVTDSYRRSMYTWYARLWSQARDVETHWTVDECENVNDENPRLYEWLCNSSWVLIERHRDDVKKGWRGPSARSPAVGGPATPS
jgi:hypothetical protein